MKYVSNDRLSDYEFHDAELYLKSFVNDCLIIRAACLNIHKEAEQNPFDTDMELADALLTFRKCDIRSYEPMRALETDEKGQLYSNVPKVVYSGEEGKKRFVQQLKKGITVYSFGKKEDSEFYLDASAGAFFTVCFTFENVLVEWEKYKKPAWYVR